ncbi:MAG: alanine racemase [Candidatus Omnitrophica bacterium]|nr:alanine racemase [Candidatus Omnitrophota bacterium]
MSTFKSPSKKFLTVWAEVDLGQLRRNARAIRSHLGRDGARILAIVKADAYGHGMKAVAAALESEGVNFFGVANIDEAAELRGVCPGARILVLGSFHKSQVPAYLEHRVIPTISSLEDADVLERILGRRKRSGRFPVHVKFDTGMGRLGIWHEEADHFLAGLAGRKGLAVEGAYTHFANADRRDKMPTTRQILFFNAAVKKLASFGFSPSDLHSANSLGLARFRTAHFNLVRPGILLYGINPIGSGKMPITGLEPILSLKTRISFLRDVEKGRAISYGSTYRTSKKTRIATLPVGYSHGYRVGFSNRAFALVRGIRCRVVGRVTMDHTLIDVGAVPSARRWDEVTLIGAEGKERVSSEELAALIGTVPYEIPCAIHSRIPRVYLNSNPLKNAGYR